MSDQRARRSVRSSHEETVRVGYVRAPIVECSLTFVFDRLDVARVVAFFDDEKLREAGFTQTANVVRYEGTAEGTLDTPAKDVTMTPEQIGRAARTDSQDFELAAAVDQLRFVSRREYTKWEDFTANAKHWLTSFVGAVQPLQLKRIIAGFENELPVPDSDYQVSDYVRLFVNVPAALPQSPTELMSSVTLQLDADIDAQIDTTSSLSPDRLFPTLHLDIETRLTAEIDLGSEYWPDLERRFVQLRRWKNHVFEASITDATRMLMQGADHAAD